MALFSGSCSGRTTHVNSVTNRTYQSRGSLGGDKKAGIFGGAVGWPQGNMGYAVFWRAPQRIPTVAFSLANTTRHPVTRRTATYGVISGIF
jgi:hypothetical protein